MANIINCNNSLIIIHITIAPSKTLIESDNFTLTPIPSITLVIIIIYERERVKMQREKDV